MFSKSECDPFRVYGHKIYMQTHFMGGECKNAFRLLRFKFVLEISNICNYYEYNNKIYQKTCSCGTTTSYMFIGGIYS